VLCVGAQYGKQKQKQKSEPHVHILFYPCYAKPIPEFLFLHPLKCISIFSGNLPFLRHCWYAGLKCALAYQQLK
jgi:hypothetical protein